VSSSTATSARSAAGLPVVSDLRARDVAAGGHGAPLAGILDGLWLGGPGGPRAALNLGGIANVSVVGEDGGTRAWDTGPANCLLDLAAARATDGRLGYDRDGALAAAGTVSPALLARLREHPYLTSGTPASTGREVFSAGYLDAALESSPPLPWEDVLATLVELTAATVAAAVLPHAPTEVVASGGGTANPVLMGALAGRLGAVPLLTSDDRGLPSDGKESVLWALLGFLTWHGVPVATGERRPRVLGRLSPGDEPLRLPAPVPAPRRLRVTTKELVR
jgi:anhydro-N-acetylmuramic acid kinase